MICLFATLLTRLARAFELGYVLFGYVEADYVEDEA